MGQPEESGKKPRERTELFCPPKGEGPTELILTRQPTKSRKKKKDKTVPTAGARR